MKIKKAIAIALVMVIPTMSFAKSRTSQILKNLNVIKRSNLLIDSVDYPAQTAAFSGAVGSMIYVMNKIIAPKAVAPEVAAMFTTTKFMVWMAGINGMVGVLIDLVVPEKADAATVEGHYSTVAGFKEFLNLPLDTQLAYAEQYPQIEELVASTAEAVQFAETK